MTDLATWLGVIVVLSSGVGWVVARGTRLAIRLLVTTAFATSAIWATALLGRTASDRELTDVLPNVGPAEGYGTSNACRSCHPGHYGSWHDSFHRTMTQAATPEAVLAPFDGRILEERGYGYEIYERDGRFYTIEVDPDSGAPVPDALERRIALTTGSHNVQAYWYAEEDGALVQLPFVFFIHEERWLANDDSFLQGPYHDDDPLDRYVWTDGCITCHSTGGPWNPEKLGVVTSSKLAVTELGIACERCHGPAEEHVRTNQSPARRYAMHGSEDGDPTIVNPRRLDAERSASVCGHCHTVAEDRRRTPPGRFMPGERLGDYLDFEAMFDTAEQNAGVRDMSTLEPSEYETVESFWTNAVPRVAGREYDAMIRSGCYLEGGMSCITCHTMHGDAAGKQLPRGADNETFCGGTCHADIVRDVSAHTHHEVDSTGSECVNCHMPYASYGLLSATRSHRLDSPIAGGVEGRDAPNACNLCHLDQSLGWTADHVAEWYGTESPTLPDHLRHVPAGALWMLRGDAVQRAIAAWHAGWDPAREASDIEALRPGLASLMQDDYSAVRQVAGRTVRTHDPSLEIDMDALTRDPQPELYRAVRMESALVDEATIARLLEERDDNQVSVPE